MCDRARLGTSGDSVDEEDVADERGWLVTVADRLGKYDAFASTGDDSCGETSGDVMEEE